MPTLQFTVNDAGGAPVRDASVEVTVAGMTTILASPWPVPVVVPDTGLVEFVVSSPTHNQESLEIALKNGIASTWSNPNAIVERGQTWIAVTIFLLAVQELPQKLIQLADAVGRSYPEPYGSRGLKADDQRAVEHANDLLLSDLFARYRGYAAVVDAGGNRPQYFGFDDFPKKRATCVDPNVDTAALVTSATAVGWDRVRHSERGEELDPTLDGVSYVLEWRVEGQAKLLVGVYVPKVHARPTKRTYCVFYTANTAKPEFQTQYPFGWRWFPESFSMRVRIIQPYFDVIARFLFQGHFLALQTLCAAALDPPPVMIVPVWNHGSADSTPLVRPGGLVALVNEVALFVHGKGLDDPVTTPVRDERTLPNSIRQAQSSIRLRQYGRPPISDIAVACHSAAIDNILTLAEQSPGTMEVGPGRNWSYLWLQDPVWRERTPQVIKTWIGKRQDRRALVVNFLSGDYVTPLGLRKAPGSIDGIAVMARSDDGRISVFQGAASFLAGPDTGIIPKNHPQWGTSNNDEHQFVPNLGVGLGIKLAKL
jgi:hypothetical protein